MPGAEEDIEQIYQWLVDRSALRGQQWFNGLIDAIGSLALNPKRCSLAPEDPFFEEEIRQLLYGRGRGMYRILFTINEDTAAVLHVRHGSRRRVQP